MTNLQRISLASFLAYFVMSGMLAPIGIISGPMAEYYGESLTTVTARFSWLTVGIFVGAVLALFVFAWMRIRQLMIGLYVLLAASVLSLGLADDLSGTGLRLGLVGMCCGVGLAAAALVIARSYDDNQRASMLVITDGSFSVAGVVTAWLAVYLLSNNFAWYTTYQSVGVVALLVVALAAVSSFPEMPETENSLGQARRWPAEAWVCVAALALYTVGQNSILWWLPQHAQDNLGVTAEQAGQFVGQYWSGMFAAQVFVAWWVYRIGVRNLLRLAALTTLSFSLPFWLLPSADGFMWLAAAWGFANLGLLKIILSFATEVANITSSQLVSALLLGATSGTALSPWLSSQIVALGAPVYALQFGSLCFAMMLGLVLWASRRTP